MAFSGYQDFNPDFSDALQQMISARPGISIYSGYRTPERQAELYQDALVKYGSEAEARRHVAPPGKSRHNHGLAADLAFASDADKAWAHENAAKFGLNFRMGHEPWHIEMVGGQPTAVPNAGAGGISPSYSSGNTPVVPTEEPYRFEAEPLARRPFQPESLDRFQTAELNTLSSLLAPKRSTSAQELLKRIRDF